MVDPVSRAYKTSSHCSIEFEVDGPYKVGAGGPSFTGWLMTDWLTDD